MGMANKFTDTKGGREGGMNWGLGLTCTLLGIKFITHENLLDNIGNSTQRSVVT